MNGNHGWVGLEERIRRAGVQERMCAQRSVAHRAGMTIYEMALVVGLRAEQLQYGATCHLDPEEMRRADPWGANFIRQAHEELRLRRLDDWVVWRPLKCVNMCTDGALVPIGNMDLDVVPGMTDDLVLARARHEYPAAERRHDIQIQSCIDPHGGASLFHCAAGGTGFVEHRLRRPIRVYASEFSRATEFIATRGRTYSGVPLVIQGRHAILLQVTRMELVAEREKLEVARGRVHTDGSIELWFDIRVIAFSLSGVASCYLTHTEKCMGAQALQEVLQARPEEAVRVMANRESITAMGCLSVDGHLFRSCIILVERFPAGEVCQRGEPDVVPGSCVRVDITSAQSFVKAETDDALNPDETAVVVLARFSSGF